MSVREGGGGKVGGSETGWHCVGIFLWDGGKW